MRKEPGLFGVHFAGAEQWRLSAGEVEQSQNSLESFGSRIVLIGNSAENFDRFEALAGRFRKPALPVVGFTSKLAISSMAKRPQCDYVGVFRPAGRRAVWRNAFTALLAGNESAILPYTLQNALTRPMHTAAARAR